MSHPLDVSISLIKGKINYEKKLLSYIDPDRYFERAARHSETIEGFQLAIDALEKLKNEDDEEIKT